ncbi:hypothetical protein NA57DRAFT_78986 [Rhizodiscina lignyota]|uniref:PSI domain-containing protein n=1 Tax=Rhizodiscina lignyota TaxID=1504668 RepID=A0A9P4IB98_9PEZI|nr:hypothetical protein NA57DRAFT_78986 [Rhizodiscina lignyota]
MASAELANASSVLPDSFLSRFKNSEDDLDRFLRCWKIQDCGDCMKDDAYCGWCPFSATCVPLPQSNPAPLLAPFSKAYNNDPICPLETERYELRTPALGCYCSPITLLAALITCASTIVGLFILYVLFKSIAVCWRALRAGRYGWEIVIEDDGDGKGLGAGEVRRIGSAWKRERRGWLWARRSAEFEMDGEEVLEDGSGLKGRGWRRYVPAFLLGGKKRGEGHESSRDADERTALLGE